MNNKDAEKIIMQVASILGASIVPTESTFSLTLEIQPEVFLQAYVASSNSPERGKLIWTSHYPKHALNNMVRICTSLKRSPEVIAADVKRRLIPHAIKYCAECRKSWLESEVKRQIKETRKAELEQILGKLEDSHTGLKSEGWGFSIRPEYLRYDNRYIVTLEIKSWHCLLKIAELVAEDLRVWKSEGVKA
jgi:hypothetical protein